MSQSQTTTTPAASFPVQLAIYDLSHGMARALSAQFLGGPQYAIDIIPHTGILVYGREYFFGGGIQSEDPVQFRASTGLQPVQVLSLGSTTVSRTEFELWCWAVQQPNHNSNNSSSNRNSNRNSSICYSAAWYDLLSRNCNHFSHDAATIGLRLATGVPEWILQVPQRFLSSPMGQLVRPMLQNMQLTAPVVGAQPVVAPATTASLSTASRSVAVSPNPWATTTATATTTTSLPTSGDRTTPLALSSKWQDKTTTPLLDSYTKPLLSNDTKTVAICIQKLLPTVPSEHQIILEEAGSQLSQPSSSSSLDLPRAEQLCGVLHGCLESTTAAVTTTYSLMLLRVVLLQIPKWSSSSNAKRCLEWIQTQVSTTTDNDALTTTAARSMAWLCAANAVGTTTTTVVDDNNNNNIESLVDALVESAVADLTRPSPPPVGQAVSAFMYNVTLLPHHHHDNEALSDRHVSILCAAVEGLGGDHDHKEEDACVRLRRLMMVGRILKQHGTIQEVVVNPLAKSLLQDLGLVQVLQQLEQSSSSSSSSTLNHHPSGDDAKVSQLAAELLRLMD